MTDACHARDYWCLSLNAMPSRVRLLELQEPAANQSSPLQIFKDPDPIHPNRIHASPVQTPLQSNNITALRLPRLTSWPAGCDRLLSGLGRFGRSLGCGIQHSFSLWSGFMQCPHSVPGILLVAASSLGR